jgi:hypothetical protein
MYYLLSDSHGFTHEVLEIQPDTLTKFDMQRELDYFIRIGQIKKITEFDISGFQKYISNKYGISTKSVRPIPLSLRV